MNLTPNRARNLLTSKPVRSWARSRRIVQYGTRKHRRARGLIVETDRHQGHLMHEAQVVLQAPAKNHCE
jgi:hypothetical protein